MIWTATATVTLSLVYAALARPSDGLWDVNIFEGPAPSPEDGPAFSRNALRDPSKLKYEIVGIVGAYILWLLVTCLLIALIRGRFRRRALRHWHKMELEKPSSAVAYGPRSPGMLAGTKSWANLGNRASHRSLETMSSIDHQVVEMDKIRNMDEMANLYAAVIAHDEKKPHRSVMSSTTEVTVPRTARSQTVGLPSSPRDKRPTQFFPLASPRSPEFPPYQSMQAPASPRGFPQSTPFYVEPTPLSPQYPAHWLEQQPTPMASHFPPELQHLRDSGVLPAAPPARATPAVLNPAYHPAYQDDGIRSMNSSRSSDGSAAPASVSASPAGSHRRTGSGGTNKPRPINLSIRHGSPPQPAVQIEHHGFSPIQEEGPPTATYVGGLPTPVPDRHANTSRASEQSTFSQQATVANNPSMTNSTSTLPFRQYYSQGLTSAPPTKTTFVDRRDSHLKAPRTGVPQTPYSAYTPFTPMTPITPRRLVTKQELKKKRKEASRRHENDLVPSPQDMWGEE